MSASRRLVLVVDDHAIVREGLVRILERAGEDWEVAEVSSGFEALEWLQSHPDAEIAIVDLSMPGMSGLELIRRLRAEFPRLRVLVLSMHAEEEYALRAFHAGAHGYVTKDRAAAELINAVSHIAGGRVYVTPSLAEYVVQRISGSRPTPPHDQLSDREMDVLRRLVAGQRISDIAQALHLSVKTVSSHKRRIQDKLNLASTAALIRYGIEQGLQEAQGRG